MAIHLATCLHLSCIYGEEAAGAVRCGSVWTLPRPPYNPCSTPLLHSCTRFRLSDWTKCGCGSQNELIRGWTQSRSWSDFLAMSPLLLLLLVCC